MMVLSTLTTVPPMNIQPRYSGVIGPGIRRQSNPKIAMMPNRCGRTWCVKRHLARKTVPKSGKATAPNLRT